MADHLPSLLFRIVREDPLPPQRLNPTLGPQVDVVLRKSLSKNAGERFPNCAEFVEALGAACYLNPNWQPLPRSSAQSMPTIGGGAAIDHGGDHGGAPAAVPMPRPAEAVPPPPEMPPPRQPRLEEEAESGNPLLKTLVWMLVGIGVVALVLFGAQKFLFNRNAETPPAAVETKTPPSEPARSAETSTPKPSPMGEPKTPVDTAQAAAAPARDKPPVETPRRETTTPVSTPKPGQGQTVQLLTDPPGAQVTIDGDSALTCKTPCMLPVATGRHSLNVQLAGYRSFPRVINVPQDGDIFLQLTKAAATLSVTSNPPGASIEINGETQAKRAPALFNLSPGNYHVKVARGSAFLDFDVQLKDGEFVTKNVSF
jgi:hypothetical protein